MQRFNQALNALLLVAVLVLSGCVSSGKYEAMVQERDAVQEEKARLEEEKAALQAAKQQLEADKADLTAQRESLASERDSLAADQARLKSVVTETEQEKREAAMKAAEAEAEIARQQQVYQNLQQTFAQEQQANQVKIEMMKSGVKVNLANDILFPSGSAELNAQGEEVLKRAAEELKKSPYQTVVAGFTDNVAISGNLKEKYPSNWELAGARAASVVRLLEKEGVPSAQLLAISFGENSPVASNETPEERSKNRRIEIILRPAPVTMN